MIDENDRKPRPLVAARAAQTAKNRALARQPRSRAKFFSSLLERAAKKVDTGFSCLVRVFNESGAGLAPTLRRAYQAPARTERPEDAMGSDNGRDVGEQRRHDRLAAALRENLKRRKAQQRGRTSDAGAATGRPADASRSSGDREG